LFILVSAAASSGEIFTERGSWMLNLERVVGVVGLILTIGSLIYAAYVYRKIRQPKQLWVVRTPAFPVIAGFAKARAQS
jgi:hypothetical protein